jgi:hypothetical protein
MRILLAAVCLSMFATSVHAQQTVARPAGVVTGRVFDAVIEQPIREASVRVVGQNAATVTDADGQFTLRAVIPGIVQLEVRGIGYAPMIRSDVAVSGGKPVVVAIGLTKVVTRLEQVTVRPTSFPVQPPATTPVSAIRFDAEELRRTPGALEDVVAAISVAPGIATTTGGRNDLFVRGGAAFENLFVVDNIEVPNINHFGTQGSSGGPISLMNVRFIDNANLSAGGFGVRYGDRVASVTNLTLREGNRERMSGEINIAASQFGAIAEGPIGTRASFLFNVRRSYLDLLFKALGVAFIPTYTDLTFKATWRPTARDAISALTVGALDKVDFNNEKAADRVKNSRVLGTTQDQYFSGVTWKRLLGNGVATTTLGRTWTRYQTAQFDSLQPPNPIFRANTTEGENSLRTDVAWQLTPAIGLDVGNIAKFASRLRYDVLLPGYLRQDQNGVGRPLTVDTNFTAFRNGSYTQLAVQATPNVRLTAGLRTDYYGFLSRHFVVAPRASITVRLDEPTSLSLSAGRYYQAPPFIWLIGDGSNHEALAPLRADQVVASLQHLVGTEWRWQLETYGKRYASYPARVFRPGAVLQPSGFDDVTADIPFGLEPLSASGAGTVFGVEALLQKKLGERPFYGLAAFSYNHTRFTGTSVPSTRGAFDTPLIANLVGGWRPNARWEVSGRGRASIGLPYTPIIGSGPSAGTLDFSRYNGERLPLFAAADARVDRRWVIGRTQLIAFIDVANVNGRENVSGFQWNPRTRQIDRLAGFGVFPTIGVNWEF